MTITLYHNPRCSKSRQAKALLEEKGIDFSVREYLKQPLTESELKVMIELLEIAPHDLLRKKESEYQEHNLAKDSELQEIIKAIAASPKLMERPIVATDTAARIGRPTEAILEIL